MVFCTSVFRSIQELLVVCTISMASSNDLAHRNWLWGYAACVLGDFKVAAALFLFSGMLFGFCCTRFTFFCCAVTTSFNISYASIMIMGSASSPNSSLNVRSCWRNSYAAAFYCSSSIACIFPKFEASGLIASLKEPELVSLH